MKPIFYSPIIVISLAASILTSCEKKASAPATTDAAEAESQKARAEQAAREEALRQERAAIEEERRQAALDKAEAQQLRDESEDLRAEAELRQSISKLAGEAASEAKGATPKIASTTSEPEPTPEITPVPETVTYEPFYNDLADDGQWMDSSDYGYVWQPTISTRDDWAPYTDGSWSYTDYGWAWDSRESFGSICYHYGRWTRLRNIGWVWVPGHDWAPAWVSWRTGDDCIGWAPLPPAARWHRNLGIHGWVDATCHISPVNYCFVNTREIFHPRCREVILPRRECEERFLHSRNVTALTEVKKPGSTPIVRCDGPPVDKLKEHFRGEWRERRINFHGDAVASTKPRVQTEGEGIPMRQWSLRQTGENRQAKPKVVAKELPPALDVTPAVEIKNPQAIKRLLASEASAALQQTLPPAANRGPRSRVFEASASVPATSQDLAGAPKASTPDAGTPPVQPTQPAQDPARKMRERDGKISGPPAQRSKPAVVAEQPKVPTPPTIPDAEKSNQDLAKAKEMAEAAKRDQHLHEQQIAENQRLEEAARLREIKRETAESKTQTQDSEKETNRERELAMQQKHREAEALALEKIQQAELQRLEEDRKRKMELSQEQKVENARNLEMAKQKDLEARKAQEAAQRAEAMREKQDAAHQAELAQQQELAQAKKLQQEAQRTENMREKQDAAHQAELAQQQALAQARKEQEAGQRAEAMREKQDVARQAEIARQQEMAQARKEQEAAQRAEAMREKQEAARQAEIARQQEMAQARRQQEDAQRAAAMCEKQEAAHQAEAARQQAMAEARRQQDEARRAEAERHQKEAAERARGDGGRNAEKKGLGR